MMTKEGESTNELFSDIVSADCKLRSSRNGANFCGSLNDVVSRFGLCYLVPSLQLQNNGIIVFEDIVVFLLSYENFSIYIETHATLEVRGGPRTNPDYTRDRDIVVQHLHSSACETRFSISGTKISVDISKLKGNLCYIVELDVLPALI
ncbi:hypothetical protein ANN_22386 [Periplaneta americana]|uniref:Uncharacterized protein n=1 Tax=Periplaneta americana TaxID=6978 RepID=A0ABQ8S8T5_PERAM|nr:hypothetical protein ANN_22386 [Periplaneta americana]